MERRTRGSKLLELIFIRHGEPQWAVAGIAQDNPGLTKRGHEQAALVAEVLATQDRPVSEIIVSPARRALETAEPLINATGFEPHIVEELSEIRMPDWSDTPDIEVQHLFRKAQQRHPDDWWTGMPGGEAFGDFHKRIAEAIVNIVADRGAVALEGGDRHMWHLLEDIDQRIVVVAHAGTNSAAMGTLLHIEPTPWEWDRFALGHASISRVRLIPLGGEHVFSMRALNDRAHLPRQHRTR